MVKLFAMFAVLSGFAFAAVDQAPAAEPADQASCEAASRTWDAEKGVCNPAA